MLNAISTLGITVGYCVETTAGTRPTGGFTKIAEIRDIPEIGNIPDALDATPLEETVMRRYIAGLADTGGVITLTANMSDALQTAWATCVSAAETAATATPAKATWFEIKSPKLAKSYFFSGMPIALGYAGSSVNAVQDASLNIMPNGVEGWGTKTTT